MSDPHTWKVGDIIQDPARENLPDKTVLIDIDGDPWQLSDGGWRIPGFADQMDHMDLRREWGPYVVAWLPEAYDD